MCNEIAVTCWIGRVKQLKQESYFEQMGTKTQRPYQEEQNIEKEDS